LEKISNISGRAQELYKKVGIHIFCKPPYNLGFPSEVAQSAYYPSSQRMTNEDIDKVGAILREKVIHPLKKLPHGDRTTFSVLQASAEEDKEAQTLFSSNAYEVVLERGDHSNELKKICDCLEEAQKYSASPLQEQIISKYMESFDTGNMESYRDSQRLWVKDRNPAVETILGFVEPYRDPYGVRAEFEGVVGIVDANETKVLTTLVENSSRFIRRLPWAKGYGEEENRGMGPFEKDIFDPPDFTSLQGKITQRR
jgi:dipeptidyl-peptidase III